METGNVVNPPLVTGSQDERILDLCFFPEMHIMTGNVEKLVRELERCQGFTSEEHGSNFMYLWMKKNNICKSFHRGSPSFKGNMARKLLHFSPDLKDYSVQQLNETQLPHVLPYIEALRLLDRVIESCFKQTRSPDFI